VVLAPGLKGRVFNLDNQYIHVWDCSRRSTRLVPGLADPAGVSFELVNIPGRYLRHSNFAVRQDATFQVTY
jgi:hypothetical protein